MKTITYGPNEIVLFDALENLPPHRESLMNFYLLSEMGIGHNFEDVGNHLSSVRIAAANKDDATLAQAIENLMLCYLSMAGKYNPKYIAWICLIYKINGDLLTDTSEDNLKDIALKLSKEGGIEMRWEQVFTELKKKLPTNLLSTSQTEEEISIEDLTFTDVTT